MVPRSRLHTPKGAMRSRMQQGNALRSRRLLSLACLLAGLLPACNSLVGRKENSTPPIDSNIRITLSEQLSRERRTLTLNCATTKIYPCVNYQLDYSLARQGNTFIIQFHGVSIGEICFTATGPARASIDLGSLGAGVYRLVITNGDRLISELNVTTDSYVVSGTEGPTITFPAPRLNRVPDYTVWGLIGYASLGDASVAQAYLDSLEARGATTQVLAPGDYGYFSIDQNGEIVTPPNHGYYFALPYVRRFAGDPTSLQDVVRYFGQTQIVSVRLLTWRGDTYYSWVLAPT